MTLGARRQVRYRAARLTIVASRLRPPMSRTTCRPTQPSQATRPRSFTPNGSWMTASLRPIVAEIPRSR